MLVCPRKVDPLIHPPARLLTLLSTQDTNMYTHNTNKQPGGGGEVDEVVEAILARMEQIKQERDPVMYIM